MDRQGGVFDRPAHPGCESDLMAVDVTRALSSYAAFFERLTPETVGRLSECVISDARVPNPFCDLTGVGKMQHLIHNLYTDVQDPQVAIRDRAVGSRACYLRWQFTAHFKGRKRTFAIDGVSEVQFDQDGMVILHHDHWDSASQLYDHFPVLRTVLGAIRRYVTEA